MNEIDREYGFVPVDRNKRDNYEDCVRETLLEIDTMVTASVEHDGTTIGFIVDDTDIPDDIEEQFGGILDGVSDMFDDMGTDDTDDYRID